MYETVLIKRALGRQSDLYMVIIWHYGAKLRLLPAHPQSWVSGHVGSKWLIPLLLTIDGEELQGRHAAAQVEPSHLVHPDADHR